MHETMTHGNAREASSPLDGVRPGLEDNMSGEVIDLRPDRFLREMREHGDMAQACRSSGMSYTEFTDLCKSNVKFDRAQVECFLQYREDEIMSVAREQLGKVRTAAYADLQQRHGTTVPKTFGKRGATDDTNCG